MKGLFLKWTVIIRLCGSSLKGCSAIIDPPPYSTCWKSLFFSIKEILMMASSCGDYHELKIRKNV